MNQLESPVHINFMGENLTPVTEVKDLGMLVDSHLTYDKHIQALSSSCISKLRQIGRVKHNFDQSTLATIIDTLVMSKINYCSTVWSNTSDGNIKKIQLIQNCAARLITGVPKYDHISPTLNALGWLSIKEHLLYRDALLTFKCMHDKAPQYLCDNFEQRNRIHNRDTRRNGDLDIPKYRTSIGQRSFKYRGTKIWNGLDTDLKSISDLNNFKTKLKTILIEKRCSSF